MHVRRSRRVLTILPLALVLLLSACSAGGGSESVTTTAATTATVASTAAATSGTAAADCSHASGFGSAGAASAPSSFADMPFPANSVSTTGSPFSDTYQFLIVSVCTASSSAAAIKSFYSSSLPSAGWTNFSTYPYHGNPTSSCGDSYCWRKASGSVRYVSLENVTTSGALALYSLRLATAPSSANAQFKIHSKSVSGSTGTLSATVSCASGEQMVSGGYEISNANRINTAFSNYPSGTNSWTASLTLYVSVATTFTADVVCLKANFLLHQQIVHNSATVAPGTTVPVTVGCPSGTTVTGGGFKATPSGYTFVVGSTPGSHGWGMATRLGAGSSITEEVYAVCARNLSGPTLSSENFTVGLSSFASSLPICTSGLRTGGGFSNADPGGDGNNFIDSSTPSSENSQWSVGMYNRDSTSAHGGVGWAVCDGMHPVW